MKNEFKTALKTLRKIAQVSDSEKLNTDESRLANEVISELEVLNIGVNDALRHASDIKNIMIPRGEVKKIMQDLLEKLKKVPTIVNNAEILTSNRFG